MWFEYENDSALFWFSFGSLDKVEIHAWIICCSWCYCHCCCCQHCPWAALWTTVFKHKCNSLKRNFSDFKFHALYCTNLFFLQVWTLLNCFGSHFSLDKIWHTYFCTIFKKLQFFPLSSIDVHEWAVKSKLIWEVKINMVYGNPLLK